jgi:RNA polymerase sigma factor (TIGR02999 family)
MATSEVSGVTPTGDDSGKETMTFPWPNEPEQARPAAELLPAVYDELRRLAAALTKQLCPGQTLQPTALVHEAYLRLVGDHDPGWQGRQHFFGAAARAMRQILIDQARRKASHKHGGQGRRVELTEGLALIEPPADDLLAVDEAIQKLQAHNPHLAEIVLLRYYAGLSVAETAGVLGISASTLAREWRFARAWLVRQLGDAPRSWRPPVRARPTSAPWWKACWLATRASAKVTARAC